ncbi:serine hydrolase domain-containing protein [Pinibacter soli]|uniref:Serine hydrolase domain-containing protein n=1 Tax=Pinibacter soli TaxID=3044211 RepID=A0ABT6RFR4_9BACT|nr:serine hydrolase domain-containing protein [Pinibacter soli]MDI3321301.1 serine hydrolase domain-containing protein [Pinibacter soli]
MPKKKTSVTVILYCAGMLISFVGIAQNRNPVYNEEIENRIKQVENNLSGQVHIQDSVNTCSLQQRMKDNGIFGVSIAVVHNYRLEWARGYGMADAVTQTPVTTRTLFQAASISKSINGIGLLKLAQDKKIDLYADINTYLTSWKFPYDTISRGKKISVANLLTHTAGLTVHGFSGYSKTDTLPSIIQILNGEKPANNTAVRSREEPGKRSQYSGGGITISQLIVEDVTHQRYDEYLWQQVLKPMGMLASSYAQPPAKDKEKILATGYRQNGKPVEGNYHIYPEEGAAGLWTNPADLAAYIVETQLSLQGNSSKVLNSEMTRLRLMPYIDSNVALGVYIMQKGDDKYFNHNGANEGFRCVYYGSMNTGNGVVVMVNSDNGSILEEIVNSVATVYGWKYFFRPEVKKAVAVTTEMANAYTGRYVLAKDTIDIRFEKKPMLIVNNQEFYPIYFSTEKDFFSLDLPFNLSFEKDASGKVKDIYFKNSGKEFRANRL